MLLRVSQKSKLLQEVEIFTFETYVLTKDRTCGWVSSESESCNDWQWRWVWWRIPSGVIACQRQAVGYFSEMWRSMVGPKTTNIGHVNLSDCFRTSWPCGKYSLVMRFHQEGYFRQELADDIIYHAMSQAATRGNLGAIRKFCRITAGYDLSIAKQHAAIRILLFQNDNPSCVEALREVGFDEGFSQVFDLIKSGVGRQVFGRDRSTPRSFTILQWNFFVAALSGNLEEVKRILDDQQTNLGNFLDVHVCENTRWWISHFRLCSTPLCAAAARGHWKVVKAILAKLTEAESLETASSISHRGHLPEHLPLPNIHYLYRSVVIIAAQKNDISIFSEKFAELENAISDFSFVSILFREARPEFVEELRQLRNFRPQKHPDMGVSRRYLECLMNVFFDEIRCHPRPCHVDFLLQEMFEQNFLSVKVLARFLLHLLLDTKRVSVVKRALLFKPRFFIDGAYLDLEDYKFENYQFDRCSESLWTRGVRLLVEAGVKLRHHFQRSTQNCFHHHSWTDVSSQFVAVSNFLCVKVYRSCFFLQL